MLIKSFQRQLSYQKVVSWYSGLTKRSPPSPPYSHIVQIGDPILRHVAEVVPVENIKSELVQKVVLNLKYTFRIYQCVGLSAPQIGSGLRVCIVGLSQDILEKFSKKEQIKKDMSLLPVTVLINPEIKITNFDRIIFPESCESVKGYWSVVPRYKEVAVEALDENGNEIALKLTGWNARIIQHEIDHLNGKLYTDIMDPKSFTCTCWQEVNERRGKVSLPFFSD